MNINADFFQQFAIFVVFYFLMRYMSAVGISRWSQNDFYINPCTGSQRSQKTSKGEGAVPSPPRCTAGQFSLHDRDIGIYFFVAVEVILLTYLVF